MICQEKIKIFVPADLERSDHSKEAIGGIQPVGPFGWRALSTLNGFDLGRPRDESVFGSVRFPFLVADVLFGGIFLLKGETLYISV